MERFYREEENWDNCSMHMWKHYVDVTKTDLYMFKLLDHQGIQHEYNKVSCLANISFWLKVFVWKILKRSIKIVFKSYQCETNAESKEYP